MVNMSAVPFLLFGLALLAYPRKMAHRRNRGARDPEPSRDQVLLFRYGGGVTLTALGLVMLFY